MDIYKYREELITKLTAVESVIAGMGAKAPRMPKASTQGHVVGSGRKPRRKLSAAVRAKMAASRKAWWANRKKTAKK